MTIGDRIAPALLRVRVSGLVVGAGFLVTPSLAVTCAHVLTDDPTAEHPPVDPVLVDFPLLGGAAVAARIVSWRPVEPDGSGDVAVLGLCPPDGARPVPLTGSDDVWGHPIRVCGFPAGFEDGRWLSGALRGRQGTGWLQIEADGPVRSGFSGAPVWDETAGGVAGMLVTRAGERTAFLVPAAALGVSSELPNPFRGLEAFGEQDSPYFFGRDHDIARLRAHLADRDLVLVVGPSGSGKSSLVRAGLLPSLRHDGVHISALKRTPGATAAETFADLTSDVEPGRSLLFVDQFEEIVDEDPALARELLTLVTNALSPNRRAVLTMRTDSLDGLLTATSADALEHAAMLVGPLGGDGLRAAITGPVKAVGGVDFEDGLVTRILADAGDEPGRLPLVEFALTELWPRRTAGRLTHEAYDEIGGVSGALTRYADRALWLPATRARDVLTRLARPDGNGGYVRRRVHVSEVDDRRTLETLAATRLVVISDDVAEIAHQALLDRWDRLRGWLAADREFLAWRADLDHRITQWEESGRDRKSLLGGVALARASSWRDKRELSARERDFIDRGRSRQRREVWNWRVVTAVITVIALVAGVLLVRTERQRGELGERLREANATVLGQESLRLRDIQPETALQLALAAWREAPGNPSAYQALLAQRQAWWSVAEVMPRDAAGAVANRDGTVIVTRDDKDKATVWHGDQGWVVPTEGVGRYAVSPDGTTLAMTTKSGHLVLWDIAGRTETRLQADLDVATSSFRFDATSGSLTLVAGHRLVAWDLRTKEVLVDVEWGEGDAVLLPDRRTVLAETTSSDDVSQVVLREVTGRELKRFPELSRILGNGEAVVSCVPDGLRLQTVATGEDRHIVVGRNPCYPSDKPRWLAGDGSGRFLSLVTERENWDDVTTYLHWPTGRQYSVRQRATLAHVVGRLTSEGATFTAMVAGHRVATRLHADRPDPSRLAPFPNSAHVAYHPDGRTWAAVIEEGVLIGDRLVPWPEARRARFTSDGRRLLGTDGRELRVYDAATLNEERRLRPPGEGESGLSFVLLSDHEVVTLYGGNLTRWRLDADPAPDPFPLASDSARLRLIADRGTIHARPGHPGEIVLDSPSGLELWDVATRRLVRPLAGFEKIRRGEFAFDASGTRVAAVESGAPGVQVWDVERGVRLARFPVDAREIVAFLDDTVIVEVSTGVQVWRDATMVADIPLFDAVWGSFRVRDRALHYLARQFRGDGKAVVREWSLPVHPEDVFDQLCGMADREFTDEEKDRMLPPGVSAGRPCDR
ncbi:trypsin-like peptidase domain-containing protein [Actinosynnema sp. CS-041913]|uniref:nSTAND1 domain-containing NTPase n=1 Tax=Actinosynnema sp. CS-041913 TaxID=3239917 RepID=UPI003D8AE60B